MEGQKIISNRNERTKVLLVAAIDGLYEREEAVKMSFLSAAAGESVFMLGPPGVAKSLVARRLKHCFFGAKSFEYLMGRFSTPEEVFGPISISKLKNEDKYERLVDAYLPGADVAFLDEIWKASPPIQNSLLTAINEKIFRNGEREIRMPLKALLAASNELPPEGQGLEALWDRFLVRLYVDNISDEKSFRAMITDGSDAYAPKVSESLAVKAEEWDAWKQSMVAVAVPDSVLDVIEHIRKAIVARNEEVSQPNEGNGTQPEKQLPIYVSDRRWKKIIGLLKASAYLDGRDSVDIVDCILIRHCIWSRNEEREECRIIVENAVRDESFSGMYPIEAISDQVTDFETEVVDVLYETVDRFEPTLLNGCYSVTSDQTTLPPELVRYANWSIAQEAYNNLKRVVYSDLILEFPHRSMRQTLKARLNEIGGVQIDLSGTGTGQATPLPLIGTISKRKIKRSSVKPGDRTKWDKVRNEIIHELENVLAALNAHRAALSVIIENHTFVNRQDAVLGLENLNTMTNRIRKLEVVLDRIGKEYGV